MTPSELKKIADQVAALLARESNSDLTAEELATEVTEAIVEVYEAIQAKSYNLIVLAHFTPGDDSFYTAAVGPLSTRAVQRARGIGERFAWDYKTRRGTGKFALVPLVRDPAKAWDAARNADLVEYEHQLSSIVPKSGEPSYEPMRLGLDDETRARITADWQVDPEILSRKYQPHCLCGRYTFAKTSNLGLPVTPGCPLHREGEGNDGEGPDRAG